MSGVLFRFCATVVSMPLAAWLLPGIHAASNEVAWVAGVFLGLIYLVLRPLAKLLLAPFNCLTFGVIGLAVDAGLVLLAASWLRGFVVDSFWWALAASFVVLVLREGLGRLASPATK